jgi:type I restriction enzyme R subunit
MSLTENEIECYALAELEKLGYRPLYGPDIAPDGESPERKEYSDVVLVGRLRAAIQALNPTIPETARDEALQKVLRIYSPVLLTNNETFHRFLTEGVPVQYRRDGNDKSDYVWLIDFAVPGNNKFVAVNQYTVNRPNYWPSSW